MRVIGRDLRAFCWLDAPDRRGEPIGAVLFMTNLVFLVLGTGSFDALLNYVQALLQLSSLLCVAAVVWWRIRWPQRVRPFKVPLYPLPPLIFIAVSVWMFVGMVRDKPVEFAWGVATLIIGVLIYLFSRKDIPNAMNGQPALDEKPNDNV
jgi:APA family basic amino acid/polyamine antiporter